MPEKPLSDRPSLAETPFKRITCPHCGEDLIAEFVVNVGRVSKTANGKDFRAEEWRESLSPSQRSVLEFATRSGLLDSFKAALEQAPHSGMPRNIEKYFLNSWMQLARPRRIPVWALEQFKELYPSKLIQFYVANFVGAVVAGGEICLFIPASLVGGQNSVVGSIAADPNGIRQWVHTKLGYVPQSARIMIEAARVRSLGELAIPDIGNSRPR